MSRVTNIMTANGKLAASLKRRISLPLSLIIVSILSICGCGGNDVVQVEPRFTVDGKPLAEASITFVRSGEAEGGRAAFGITDEQGVAKLTTYEPYDGVPPGKYAVVVIKAPENPQTFEEEVIDPADTDALLRSSVMSDQRATRRRRVRTVLPEEYSDPGTTPLACAVDPSTADLVFDIETK